MGVKNFIKDKLIYFSAYIFMITILEMYFVIFQVSAFILCFTPILSLTALLIPMFLEYRKKSEFFREFEKCIDNLDKKYIFTEVMKEVDFTEGKIFLEAAKSINQNIADEVNSYKHSIMDYKEYIEMWVHEIKTPVAGAKLITENYPNEITESIREELEKIEAYIEQTLYYSKIDSVEEDYRIKENNLGDLVHECIRKNKKLLISKKIAVEVEDLNRIVLTDSKWFQFILGQIIINSAKYAKEESGKIKFSAEKRNESVILCIRDFGIGIKEAELHKVIKKGFVGSNGRKKEATTGMGLYICHELLQKMHHSLRISSIEGEETTVQIIFPVDEHYTYVTKP